MHPPVPTTVTAESGGDCDATAAVPQTKRRRRRGIARLGRVAVALAGVGGLLACGGGLPDADHDGTIRIVVLGDSNTARGWPTPDTVRWVEMAQAMPRPKAGWRARPVEWTEVAVGGATVCNPGDGWVWAGVQLESALVRHADGIVLAFGTNDLGRAHRQPAEVVACYRTIVARVPTTVAVWIALTPPIYAKDGTPSPEVERLNDELRAAFPPAQLVDFWTGFGPDLYAGLDAWNTEKLVHLNDAGQQLRARRAVDAVLGGRGTPPRGGAS